MRIVGYCIKCRKIKTVRVTRPRPGKVQLGTCSNCEN